MELAKFTPETLALVAKATATLARCDHAMKVWGRSRSAMTLKNIVVATQRTPMRMMRQVGAELVKKKNAMIEAKVFLSITLLPLPPAIKLSVVEDIPAAGYLAAVKSP